MKVLLDTNICIAFLKGSDAGVRDRLLALSPDEVGLSSVVKAELLYGARHSAHVEDNLRRLAAFFEPFLSCPFDDAAAEIYGVIRAQLRKSGTPIGSNDLMIAATALSANVPLATRNQDEFRRVAGLRVVAW